MLSRDPPRGSFVRTTPGPWPRDPRPMDWVGAVIRVPRSAYEATLIGRSISLISRSSSLIGLEKFPALSRREFASKSLL